MSEEEIGYVTKIMHAGQKPCPITRAHATPIYQTSTFSYDTFDQFTEAMSRMSLGEPGYIYTRAGNPTTSALEEKMAALEDGDGALATSSGMAAISITILSYAKAGDHILCSDTLYGGTHELFSSFLSRLGLEFSFVDFTDLEHVKRGVKKNTTILYTESPSNPTMDIIDIKEVSNIAHEMDAILIFDNTFAPYCQRPLEVGADVIASSATKYLGGHGDTIAGIIVGPKDFINKARSWNAHMGTCISPFNAWLILRGLKTLAPRMERHCSNAMKVAKFLEYHPKIEKVLYPGLESHPHHELAKKQMRLFGGMISFEVKGDMESSIRVLNNLNLCKVGVSLGDTDTLIEHPARMTHRTMPEEERLKIGITDALIRLSVGIEDPEDIIEDLDRALKKV